MSDSTKTTSAADAVYEFLYAAFGPAQAIQYRLWMAVLRSGMTVDAIAARIGRRPTTVWRALLKNASLERDSDSVLRLLSNIASAVDCRMRITFVPEELVA